MENPLGNYVQPKSPIQDCSLQSTVQQFSSSLPQGNVKIVSPTVTFKFSRNLVPLQNFKCKLYNKTWAEIANSQKPGSQLFLQRSKNSSRHKWKRTHHAFMHFWVNLTRAVLPSKSQLLWGFFFLVLSFSEKMTTSELDRRFLFCILFDARMLKSRLPTFRTFKI